MATTKTDSGGEVTEIEGEVILRLHMFTMVPAGATDDEKEARLLEVVLNATTFRNLGSHEIMDM